MINHEKMAVAYRMAEEYANKNAMQVKIALEFGENNQNPFVLEIDYDEEFYPSINFIISRLDKLLNPQAKYQIGQTVWFESGGIYSAEVEKVTIEDDEFVYDLIGWTGGISYEYKLFATKNELIEDMVEKYNKKIASLKVQKDLE